ncbi:MAG TPA: type II secretion system F family protein, partial [Geminicoccaceae bacterium]|nr:type II secretion system F family protein [Geminicoccaceae bacterium]
ALIEQLRADGSVIIRAGELGEGALAPLLTGNLLGGRALSPKDLVLFTRELATLLRAGLPIDRALATIASVTADGPKRKLASRTLESIRGGASFAEALERHERSLPGFYVGMVRAGEAGGSLETVLGRLAEALEKARSVRESVRSALHYPVIVLVVATATLAILLTVVVPEFRAILESTGVPMPLPSRIVIAAGEWLQQAWWAVAAVIGLLAVIFKWQTSLPAGRRRWDRLKLRIPLLGDIITKLEIARFSRTLSNLLVNGVTVLKAVSIAGDTIENRFLAERVKATVLQLKKGEGLAAPLADSKVFPQLALQLVQVGEESGELEGMLAQVAEIYEDEVKRSVERLLGLLAPAITIGLGLLVAGIIGSMLSAILSAYELPV